jgi:outer membrane protein OmpU
MWRFRGQGDPAMQKRLLATTALAGAASLSTTPALAADGIRLTVGGFFKTAYMVVIDDDDEFELGNETNTDGVFSDAEIHFTGSTVLDNGLEVGARVELEGEDDTSPDGDGDQIDEAWIWFSGGFGELRMGSEDEALANACIVPPGGTGNFSAFSPNQWGANSGLIASLPFGVPFSSNSVCTGVDFRSDAQKFVYISPVFAGFQLTASYTPDASAERHGDGAGAHLGMTDHLDGGEFGDARHNFSVYGTYAYDGEGWGLTAGLGGSWEGHREESTSVFGIEEQDFYQAGLNLTFGSFAVGIVGAYYNDVVGLHEEGSSLESDVWVAGAGAAYTMDAWTFGLQYSHRENDFEDNGAGVAEDFETQQDRAVATVNYALGPGITIDGEVGYTWIDTDPEIEEALPFLPDGFDDYQALEIAVGTNITF